MTIRVLVVDDSATVRFKLKTLLEKQKMEVEQAGNVTDALSKLTPGHSIDVVVTDLRMPGLDGCKLVDTISRCDEISAVPVIVLTSSEERDDRLRNIESGAAAYFNKAGLDEDVFAATIRRFARQKVTTTELKQESRTDALTGLSNRRHGVLRLQEELHKLERYGHSFTVALLDIDHFKKVNDTHGHQTGDKVLKGVAEILKKKVRGGMAFRYGGEEMAILMPKAASDEAAGAAERLRKAIEARKIGGVAVTASFGVAQLDGAMRSGDDLVERADQALYRAKEGGRNRVERASRVEAPVVETRRWARGA